MNFIFDMDGVLINSNTVHLASWKQIASEDGVVFSDEIFWQTFGMTSEYIVNHYWGNDALTPEQIALIVDRKETVFRENIKEFVKPMEGAVEFVKTIVQKGYKLALGSSAPRINVDYTLEWLGIAQYFKNRVVAGDEVLMGKPAPDIFLKAAEKIGALPRDCIVIDDSRSGVNAGKNAGMTTIGFFSEGHRREEYEQADFVVKSFDEIISLLNLE